MEILSGCAGLALTYIILASVLLLIFIRANNINWKLKFILIPVMVWYGVVLYNIPDNFMGWPSENVPEEKQVLVLHAVVNNEKSIYLLIVDYSMRNAMALDPRTSASLNVTGIPRYYEIKFNSELYKELLRIQKLIKEQGKGALVMDLTKLRGFDVLGQEPLFSIVDPSRVLKKIDEELNH